MTESDGALTSAPSFEPPLRDAEIRAAPGTRARHGRTTPRHGSTPCHGATVRRTARQRVLPARTAGEGHTSARKFAEYALRTVLEVLDHRRPAGQLAAVAHPPVVAALRGMVGGDRVPFRELGVAVLARVDISMVDPATAEVYARYHRGSRHFAVAARITCARDGWRLAVLHV
ncbi:Rv3235 family protein [Nocardia aurea]|uniref:Rv3235 family protein n=1 Tax=Nocardia aurea TaxID=2144174 RepID=UPI0033A244D9